VAGAENEPVEIKPGGMVQVTIGGKGPDGRFSGPGGRDVGRVRMPVIVAEMPGGRSNEPLDLGTITAKLFDAFKVGDPAPDFVSSVAPRYKIGAIPNSYALPSNRIVATAVTRGQYPPY